MCLFLSQIYQIKEAIMIINICPKCFLVDKELFSYHVLPPQWYHGRGQIIYLCHDCIFLLNKQFPLEVVLSERDCIGRMQKFLTYQNQNYSQ